MPIEGGHGSAQSPRPPSALSPFHRWHQPQSPSGNTRPLKPEFYYMELKVKFSIFQGRSQTWYRLIKRLFVWCRGRERGACHGGPCGGQRTTCRNCLSSSTLWAPEPNLGCQALPTAVLSRDHGSLEKKRVYFGTQFYRVSPQ